MSEQMKTELSMRDRLIRALCVVPDPENQGKYDYADKTVGRLIGLAEASDRAVGLEAIKYIFETVDGTPIDFVRCEGQPLNLYPSPVDYNADGRHS